MRALAISLVLCVGCSCGAATETGEAPGRAIGPSATASGRASYSVHEWGLVRAGPGDTLSIGAMGPAVPRMEDMVIEKPVLYFHVSGDASIEVASVRVDALGGSIVEHWPSTGVPLSPSPTSIAWTGLRLEPSTCALAPPTWTERPCGERTPADECESLALGLAESSDASCVAVGSERTPLLFYRSTSTALTPPLAASALDSGDLEVRNDGDLVIPGRLVRFEREGSTVRVVVASPPAPHETIVVGHDWGGPELARAAVTQSLTEIGLTASEAAAFLNSWDAAFFGTAPHETPPSEVLRERAVEEESAPPEGSILYFLPAADIERLARLSFDPPPSEVHRAMAVWTALR